MATFVTKFQSPDQDVEFEELLPPRIAINNGTVVVEDPNDPPIEPVASACCDCTGGATICVPEQDRGEHSTSAVAYGPGFWGE